MPVKIISPKTPKDPKITYSNDISACTFFTARWKSSCSPYESPKKRAYFKGANGAVYYFFSEKMKDPQDECGLFGSGGFRENLAFLDYTPCTFDLTLTEQTSA